MTQDDLLAALADARDQPDGAAKIAELDQIIGYADAVQDVRVGFAARLALIELHDQSDERWRMLPPLRWCLTAVDRDPTLGDPSTGPLLRWYQRAAVATLCDTSQLSLARAEATLDDLARWLRSTGHSLRTTYGLRCRIADHVGDAATAQEWLAQWRNAPRDGLCDCAGCERADQANLLTGWGRWAEAVEVARPVLTGVLGCAEQPERALAAVQLAYLRLGRYDAAGHAHVRAYRRHRQERAGARFLANHLRFCALAGQPGRGLEILARHLPEVDHRYDERTAMEFAAAGALLCRLAASTGFARHLIHRPGYAQRLAAELTVAALGVELAATAAHLAGRFDARNGTTHQSGRMTAWLAELPVTGPVPLPPDELPPDSPPVIWPSTGGGTAR